MSVRRNHIYTPEDDVRIVVLRKEGKTYVDIATAMGPDFTENGIRHRARHLRAIGRMPTRKITVPAKKPKEEPPLRVIPEPTYLAVMLWSRAMHRISSVA